MKKAFLFSFLLLPALASAGETFFSAQDLADPAQALSRSTTPVTLAGFLLEAGQGAAVSAFAAALPEKHADLANKLRCQIEFYNGNPAGALQALINVEKPDGWSDAEKAYLQDVMSLQASFSESRSDHFSLAVTSGDAFLAQIALPALERAYERATDFYKVALSTPLRVEIYPDQASFSRAALVPVDSLPRTGEASAAKFRRLYLLSPRAVPPGYRWLDALSAAEQRLTIDSLSGGLAPVWLREGVARWNEAAWRRDGDYEPDPSEVDRLAKAALVNPTTGTLLIPFAQMEPGLRSFQRQEDVLLAKDEAADAVDFLIQEHGAPKLLELLSAFRRMPRADAFQSALGLSEAEFEDAWIKSLDGRSWTLSKGALDPQVSFESLEPVPGPEARASMKEGDALRDKRQWQGAMVQYRKALAVEGDNGVILLRAARAADALSDGKSAEDFLRRGIDKNPSYAPLFEMLGRILYDDGRYDEAQKVLQEGLEIQPFHARLHETLGYISMDVGDVASARRSFTLSLQLDPNNPELRDVVKNMPKGPPR